MPKTINTTFAKHVHHVQLASLLQVWFTDKSNTNSSMPVIVPKDPTKPILFFKAVGERIMQVPVPKWLDEQIRSKLKSEDLVEDAFGKGVDIDVVVDEPGRLDDIGAPSV
jgi:hypothetical protein